MRTPTGVREVLHGFAERRRGVLLALAVGLAAVVLARAENGATADTPEASLALALADAGVDVDVASVVWFGDGGPLTARLALFRAQPPGGDVHDIYYAEARPGRGGALLDVAWVSNLTHTSSADEGSLTRLGDHVLYTSVVGGRIDAVTLLDIRGEPDALTDEWPMRARFQNSVTNLQETGRREGFGRIRFRLRKPVDDARISTRDGVFEVALGEDVLIIDPSRESPALDKVLVEASPLVKGMPGTITWVVDTVRNLSFVGPEPIEWLEHTVFGFKDTAERAFYSLVGTDTEAEAAEDLGTAEFSEEQRRRRLELSVTDPELGWPPGPTDRILNNRVAGEGEWIAIVDDPFVNSYPGAPPAFYQTFLRADPERAYTRVYATIWDPRQVQLHIMSGTNEPESATGETGRGMAPRDPETLRWLVAGFNGGFQALHGEFGMMAEGRVYLPPKPWAATVAVFDDGRVAMGSWRPPPSGVRVFQESWATEQIPQDMYSMRQNLTSVVEDGVYNPWERWWWGAAPVNANEQTYIDRTGLCLTEEGFQVYFWGKSMGPVALGNAMIAARCVRGMHLDMNSRHTGLEFYDVARVTEGFAALDRPLDEENEFEGPMPFSDEFLLRARKGVRRMTPMRFPRYSGRDGRDFFYLTLRPTLPGPAVEAEPQEGPDAGRFDATGLPHAGWPHAFARAHLGGDQGRRSWLVRIDPARATPLADERAGEVLAYLADGAGMEATRAAFALFVEDGRYAVGAPPEQAQVIIAGSPLAETEAANAALGVDEDGFLVYIERQPADQGPLSEQLARAHVSRAVALPESVRLAFVVDGDTVAPDSFERPVDRAMAIAFRAITTPRTEVLFPDTEPLPYSRWWRMQDARVRYFRDAPPTFFREGAGLRDRDPDDELDAGGGVP